MLRKPSQKSTKFMQPEKGLKLQTGDPLYRHFKIKKPQKNNSNKAFIILFVPGTGFEPAHPCERCDLNTVRLPISPPGQSTH